MLNLIVEHIQNQITPYIIFADRVAGIAKIQTRNEINAQGTTVNKKFPVYFNNNKTNCKIFDYIDLIPNDKLKSIIYYEENGTSFIDCDGRWINYSSNIRLVCWVNLKKINQTLMDTSILEALLIKNLPEYISNLPYISKIMIMNIRPVTKDVGIFSRYTYNEAELQYLMYPYDYFAFDMTINWSLSKSCPDEILLDPAVCMK
jgi:hypothetical protein